jgi:hypothetical protein
LALEERSLVASLARDDNERQKRKATAKGNGERERRQFAAGFYLRRRGYVFGGVMPRAGM